MSQILKYTKQYPDLLRNTYGKIQTLSNKIKKSNPNTIRNIIEIKCKIIINILKK